MFVAYRVFHVRLRDPVLWPKANATCRQREGRLRIGIRILDSGEPCFYILHQVVEQRFILCGGDMASTGIGKRRLRVEVPFTSLNKWKKA